MLRNISYDTINKKQVFLSVLFIPLAIPFFGLFTAIHEQLLIPTRSFVDSLEFFVGFSVFGLMIGSIIWLPSLLFCLLIEWMSIRPSSTAATIIRIFLFEALAAIIVLSIFFGDISFLLMLSVFLTQIIRWIYLKRKNKLYHFSKSPQHDQKKSNPK
ncbi:MAG: hypothetical protein WDZ35_15345 [Crocinitomicaceae bacterium]